MTPLYPLRAWSRASDHAISSMVEVNQAALTAFGAAGSDDTADEPAPSVDRDGRDWQADRSVEEPARVDVGDTVTFSKTLADDDVAGFANSSGDTNRLHLDEEFAAETRFGEPIVHGTLVSGLISAALARIPGVTIYLSQDLEFVGPVSIGERLTARVEVIEALGDGQYRLETTVENDDEVVIDGEAVVLIDRLPEEADPR